MNAIQSGKSIPVTDQRRAFDLEQAKQFWVREADRWDGTSGLFGDTMLEAADLEPGQRVLDVGCGAGSTTIEAARRVAPTGAAIGVDISGPALALARERGVASGFDGVDFIEADAQVHTFESAAFDAVISRFGTMFFDDPVAAFANLRRALRRGGRLAVVAWQGPFESEWTAVAVNVAIAQFGRPPDLGAPGGPGPFAFADGDRFSSVVTDAGFRDVTLAAITRPMLWGAMSRTSSAWSPKRPRARVSLPASPKPRSRQRSAHCAMPSLRTRVLKVS